MKADNANKIYSRQTAGFFKWDFELQVVFPEFPCLIHELLLIPYGLNDFIVLGVDVPRLIQCSGSRSKIMEMIRLLDGSRSLEQLREGLTSEEAESFHSAQTLLFHYGLLQDGPIETLEGPAGEIAAFVGRNLDNTRINRNRAQSLTRLAHARLAAYAPASVRGDLESPLNEIGIEDFLIISDEKTLGDFAPSFMLVVADESAECNYALEFAQASETPCLFVEVGESETRIGPLILPKFSASHRCLREQLPALKSCDESSEILFWSAFALQEVFLLLAGVTKEAYINKSVRHFHGTTRYHSVYETIARVPAGKFSGLEMSRPLDLDSSAFKAWRHHCKVILPPRKFICPKAHTVHYLAGNISAVNELLPVEYGSAPIRLPEDWSITTSLPWLEDRRTTALSMDDGSLACLLQISAGHQHQDGQQRRISPSGGGLRSAGLLVRCRGVVGIEDGWFAYNADSNALEEMINIDEDEIDAALSSVEQNVPILLVVACRLQRIQKKYGDFGFNIGHLDAGVTTAYASLVAKNSGWKIRHYPAVPTLCLAHGLGIDNVHYSRIVSNVFSLSVPAEAEEEEFSVNHLFDFIRAGANHTRTQFRPENIDTSLRWKDVLTTRGQQPTFGSVLKSRRAIKIFSERPLDADLLHSLVQVGYRALSQMVSDGMFSLPITLYAFRTKGDDTLGSGVYKTTRADVDTWAKLSAPFTNHDLSYCINQVGLARASVLLVAAVDLEQSLHDYGAAGYRFLLNQCGAVLAEVWLAAHAAGLVGTLSAGVLEEGFTRAVHSDGYSQAALFGLVLGEPQ